MLLLCISPLSLAAEGCRQGLRVLKRCMCCLPAYESGCSCCTLLQAAAANLQCTVALRLMANALQVVHENFGIEEGLMTTVHATTATQVGTCTCCSSGSLCWLHLLLDVSCKSVLAAQPDPLSWQPLLAVLAAWCLEARQCPAKLCASLPFTAALLSAGWPWNVRYSPCCRKLWTAPLARTGGEAAALPQTSFLPPLALPRLWGR